jgi:hypothetical protein
MTEKQCMLCARLYNITGPHPRLCNYCFHIDTWDEDTTCTVRIRCRECTDKDQYGYVMMVEAPWGDYISMHDVATKKDTHVVNIPEAARQMAIKRRINHYFNVVSRCIDLPDELLALIATACV